MLFIRLCLRPERFFLVTTCLILITWEYLFLPAPAWAGETFNRVRAKDVLRCGVSEGIPGFSIRDAKGRWTGMDADFCRAVGAAIFRDPESRCLPARQPQNVAPRNTVRQFSPADFDGKPAQRTDPYEFSQDQSEEDTRCRVTIIPRDAFMVPPLSTPIMLITPPVLIARSDCGNVSCPPTSTI